MESLLKEYPISKPEGLALMRLLNRGAVAGPPDSATRHRADADQLGRASFDGNSDSANSSALGRLSNSVIALSKKTRARHRSATRPVRQTRRQTVVARHTARRATAGAAVRARADH